MGLLNLKKKKLRKQVCGNAEKSLKKEIEDLRRWKDLPCSWIGRINTVKMTICKQFVDSMQSPSKFQLNSSQSQKEQFSNSSGKTKKTQDSENYSQQ